MINKPHFHFDKRPNYLGSFGNIPKKRYRSKPFSSPKLSDIHRELLESVNKKRNEAISKANQRNRMLYYLVKDLCQTVGKDSMPKYMKLIDNRTNLAYSIAKRNWLASPFTVPKPTRTKIYMETIKAVIEEYKENFQKGKPRDSFGYPVREEHSGPELA